ncbi:alpha/beta-hydrolase [Xylariaceae sp. FL1272]|nr:alpha/beta-hydrolase [Xylariaceae sp. FL1272]
MSLPIKEGKIPYDAKGAGKPCETYYKVVGDLNPGVTPVIALHGGPGGGHEYLHPLTDLYTNFGLPVIFYDQIGCGASTHLREKMGDDSFWTIELFVAELENLITYFKLHDSGFHLFGLSWGGMFGSLYASRKPQGLKRLIMLSSPASIPLYLEGLQDILQEMGPEAQEIVRRCDAEGTQDSEEYQGVCARFGKMHTCRLDPVPQDLQKAFANLKGDGTSILTM